MAGLAKTMSDQNSGTTPGSRLLLLLNPTQADEGIFAWRAGKVNASSQVPPWTFIPKANAPAYIQEGTLVGDCAPSELNGVAVAGSLGPMWVIQSNFIPAGYSAVVASSELDSAGNVIDSGNMPTPPITVCDSSPGTVRIRGGLALLLRIRRRGSASWGRSGGPASAITF